MSPTNVIDNSAGPLHRKSQSAAQTAASAANWMKIFTHRHTLTAMGRPTSLMMLVNLTGMKQHV